MQTQSFEENQSVVDEITRADDQFIALSNSQMYQELKELLSRDFTYVNHLGSILNAEAFIDLLASYKPFATLQKGKPRTIHVFAKNFAIVHGVVELEYHSPAISKVGLSTYSRVWMKEDGRWLTVNLHASDAQLMESWEKLLASRHNN